MLLTVLSLSSQSHQASRCDSTAADAQQHYSQPHHSSSHVTPATYPSLGHAITPRSKAAVLFLSAR
jgi:hypothetical protein